VTLTSRAVTTAVLSAVVAAAASVGTLPLAAAAGVLVLLVGLGWSRLLRLPSRGGPGLVVALTGLGAVAVAWATEGEPVLRNLPIVVAMGLVLAFVAEMLRRGGRLRLVESVSGTVTGIVVAVACAGWVAAGRSEAGEALVITSAAGLAAAAGVSALPLAAGWAGSLVGVALGGAVGAGAAAVVPDIDPVTGLVAGAVGGLVVAALRLLFERQVAVSRRRTAGVAAAAAPVAVGGILVFAVGRVVIG
jgi:CDP-diglyceride synthetase